MHRPFLLQNAALDILRRVRTRVLLHDVRVLHRHRPVPLVHRQNFSSLALGTSGHHLHQIAVPYSRGCWFFLYFSHGPLPHFRRERDDLGEFLLAQLAGYRPENARANRLIRIVNQNCRVIVEPDVRSVLAALFFAGAYHHRFHNRALLHLRIGRRFFYRGGNNVAQSRGQTGISPDGKNARQLARAGIVGHRQPCSHLYHCVAPLEPSRTCCRTLFLTTPRASNAAALPSTATALAWTMAASKRSPPCRPPSLRQSHRARNTSSRAARPGDKADVAPRGSPSPRWSSASWCW